MRVIDFKDASCRHCYKCVRNCEVKAISVEHEQAHIMKDHCINCGHCLEVCPQNAKTFASDMDRVKGYLRQGMRVVISIAPSYLGVLEYDTPGQVVDALKRLGFWEVRETAEGAALVTKEYRRLLKEGKIRHIGLSTHNPEVAKMAALQGEIGMILFSINPAFDMMPAVRDLDQYFADTYDENLGGIAPIREELYKICEQQNVGITVMKGYAGGRLFDAKTSPFGVALTPVQCLHYALTRPAVASVMAGFDTPEHVYAATAYETASDQEKDYASVLAAAPKHAFSTGQCTYCGHCAPCPKKIDIAMVNKLYDLATMQKEIPGTVRAHYQELKANASDCIGCKGCESRCPFHVSVAERMEKTRELFG